MAVDGVGGLTVGGDRLDGVDGVDGHPVDGGIEVGDPEPNGAADADEWNESAHAPVEELARTDAEVFAGFVFGKQATFSGIGVCLHDANRAVSTERRVLPNTRRYANLWVREMCLRKHIWPHRQVRFFRRKQASSLAGILLRNNFFCAHGNCLSGQTVAGTGDSSAERVDEYTFAHATVRPHCGTNLIAQWNCLVTQKLSCRHDNPLHVQRFSARTDNCRDLRLIHKLSLRNDICPAAFRLETRDFLHV